MQAAHVVLDRIALRVGASSQLSRESANIVQWLTEALEAVDPWPPDFNQSEIDYLNEQPTDERDKARIDLEDEYEGQALAEERVESCSRSDRP
jgi:hypothetical protein